MIYLQRITSEQCLIIIHGDIIFTRIMARNKIVGTNIKHAGIATVAETAAAATEAVLFEMTSKQVAKIILIFVCFLQHLIFLCKMLFCFIRFFFPLPKQVCR